MHVLTVAMDLNANTRELPGASLEAEFAAPLVEAHIDHVVLIVRPQRPIFGFRRETLADRLMRAPPDSASHRGRVGLHHQSARDARGARARSAPQLHPRVVLAIALQAFGRDAHHQGERNPAHQQDSHGNDSEQRDDDLLRLIGGDTQILPASRRTLHGRTSPDRGDESEVAARPHRLAGEHETRGSRADTGRAPHEDNRKSRDDRDFRACGTAPLTDTLGPVRPADWRTHRADAKEPSMFSKILVPLDAARDAETALPLAETLAKQLDEEVVLIAVLPEDVAVSPVLAAYEAALARMAETRRVAALAYLDGIRERLLRNGVPASTAVRVGPVAATIVEMARTEGAGLIAMATHGQVGPQRWFLGSVADEVARSAEVPVLLVRPGEAGTVVSEPPTDIIVPLDGSALAERALSHRGGPREDIRCTDHDRPHRRRRLVVDGRRHVRRTPRRHRGDRG